MDNHHDGPSIELENFLPYRLSRISEAVSHDFSRIYRNRHGMTRPEWRVLASVAQYDGITARDICRHSAQHKTKVSRAVSRLEQRRWLVRTTAPDDRRVEYLSLTPAGRLAYRELAQHMADHHAALMASLGAVGAGEIEHALDRLERHFLMPFWHD